MPISHGASPVASALGFRLGATPRGLIHTNIPSWVRPPKPDISTLLGLGHFYFGLTQDEAVDLSYTKTKIDTTVDGAQEKFGDLYLGWTAAGEWVNYTVDVQSTGLYAVNAHMTSRTDAAEISLAVDGVDMTGRLRLPTTTHWHIWRTVPNLAQVKLEKGTHVLRLSVHKEGNCNLN